MTDDRRSPPRPSRGQDARRRWPYVLLALPLLLILVLAAVVLFLRTDHGLQRVETLLNSVLSDVAGQQITLIGLQGRFPFDLRLHELRLADAEGEWLGLDDLVLRWSGRDLLKARVRILELSAARLELLRTPAPDKPEPEPKKTFQDFELPKAFPKVVLERLEVQEIILAEAVTGKRLVLKLRGDLDAGADGARVNLRLESLAGPNGPDILLTLKAGFVLDTNILDVQAAFADPQGSLAPLLGLPKATPLALRLDGDGPPAAWNGVFAVQAGRFITLKSELALDWSEHPGLEWKGDFLLDPALLPNPADAYLPRTAFQVRATMPHPEHVHLAEISLSNPMLRGVLNADLDLAQSAVQGKLRLDVLDTAPLHSLTGLEPGPEMHLRVEFAGPFSGPEMQIALNLTDISAGPVRAAGLELEASVTVAAGDVSAGQTVSARGALGARGLHVPQTALPPELTLRFDLDYLTSESFLDLKSLDLLGPGVDVHASAGYALHGNQLDARLEISPTEIQPWLSPYNLEYSGVTKARITATGTVRPMDLGLDVQVGLDRISGLPAFLPGLLGDAVDLSARIDLLSAADDPAASGPGLIRARDIRLRADALQIDADAAFTLATRELIAQAALELPDLSQASPNPDLHLTGSAVLELEVLGNAGQDLSLHAVLHSQDVAVADLDAFPLRVVLHADALPAAPRGALSLTASPLQTDIAMETAFALDENILRLAELRLVVPEGTLHGRGDIDLDTQMITAELQGRIENIAPLSALAGQDMSGALDLQLNLLPEGPETAQQNAQLSATLTNFQAGFGTLAKLDLKATAHNLFAMQTLDMALTARDFQSGKIQVSALEAQIIGTLSDLALNASARGEALHAFSLQLEAAYAEQEGGRVVHLSGLTGDWAEQDLFLTAPVSITLGDRETTLSPLLLEFGQAVVRADARIKGQDSDLRLGVENLPLAPFTSDVRGALTFGAVLHGPNSALRGDVTLLGLGLSPAHSGLENVPALDLQVDLALNGETIAVFAELREEDHADALLQARGQARMTLRLEPFGLDLPRDAPVTATLLGDLDLNWLGDMLLSDSQLLTGILGLDFQLAGTIDAPEPDGTVTIREAGYQHLLQGIVFQNINGQVRVTAKQLLLQSLTATDGAQGSLRVEGRAELDPKEGYPFNLTLRGENMTFVDNSLVRAKLANVALDASGSTAAQEVRGRVDLDQVDVFLKDMGGPRVVDLPVVEQNGPRSVDDQPAAPSTPAPSVAPPVASPVTLDVDVRFPARVFVRGRGLDSEWGGNLHVSGTAAAPVIRGEIRPQRGRLELLGRRFTVERESVVQFTGGQPPRPFVNLVASQTRRDPDGDKTFTVRISGIPPDMDPPLLESVPPLPQDEILAQMLFGRSLSRITPTQAAQLALAARELAGHGSGLDLMGTARDILHLDDLDLVSGQGGDMSLRAGKYIHERVYLRLDSDLKTGEETAAADVELTPRISLESTFGSRGGGLGLFWKRDY